MKASGGSGAKRGGLFRGSGGGGGGDDDGSSNHEDDRRPSGGGPTSVDADDSPGGNMIDNIPMMAQQQQRPGGPAVLRNLRGSITHGTKTAMNMMNPLNLPGVGMGQRGGPGMRNMSSDMSVGTSIQTKERPSYRLYEGGARGGMASPEGSVIAEDDEEDADDDDDDSQGMLGFVKSEGVAKAKNIEQSAGTHRLQRILNKQQHEQMLQEQQNQQEDGGGGGGKNGNNNGAGGTPGSGGGMNGATSHNLGGGTSHFNNNNLRDPSDPNSMLFWNEAMHPSRPKHMFFEKLSDPRDVNQVARLVSRVVLPPLSVHPNSIGGQQVLHWKSRDKGSAEKSGEKGYPDDIIQQEVLCIIPCSSFESTGQETVSLAALQYPKEYTKHKRQLGLLNTAHAMSHSLGGGYSHHIGGRQQKLRYVILARSTTRPLCSPAISREYTQRKKEELAAMKKQQEEDMSEQGDYDTMFHQSASFGGDDNESTVHTDIDGDSTTLLNRGEGPDILDKGTGPSNPTDIYHKATAANDDSDEDDVNDAKHEVKAKEHDPTIAEQEGRDKKKDDSHDDEIASFPVLVCMTLNSDGTAPDVRKLVPLQRLTTIQNLHATVVQLAFDNGDTIRLDFGTTDDKVAENSLDKERFIWSLIQIHAMLCLSVVERTSIALSASNTNRLMLPALNIRNLDRAELQYVATVNGFVKTSKIMCALIDRQQKYLDGDTKKKGDGSGDGGGGESKDADEEAMMLAQRPEMVEKLEMERRDNMAYDLMMGNFNMRVSLFQSDEERKDAEEILNSTEWTSSLSKEETAAVSVAERLLLMLQMRMRDLEAETCRRLIAWEDEKHFSATGRQKLFSSEDERDTVDALALASLFKTLEALDTELQDMEIWLQERAAAIKPLTDDCADIEEENRQLEQQWKSYDMLGSEMRRLLQGMDLDADIENVLKNPASALVYDEGGRVDVVASDDGVEQIYQAGKALQEKMEFPKKSGGLHLDAVSERAERLAGLANTFCTALAHIIVTVMEQFNEEVLAGSDYGKVSKNDTHAMIAKKIRDTQRKFQSALLGYIKLIEILAALSPDMLPALRDAYSEMVAESILMKKRMKGYFQALPGKNAAYMNKAGKDLKEYVPFDDEVLEMVNAPDIKAALSELLPVIAREAYFTSALFGAASKEQDGREKKRNFESTRKAVDNASQHFRYYIERTCGILPDQIAGRSTIEGGVKGDPLLCLVGSIYLNEAMDNYIDREKKGGDHSLSLAYVRATILDLRKKADKQWVGWVDKQISWIQSNEGVPLNGKRAGIFPSFARFPSYLDHLLLATSEGREEDYVPDIVDIKVINYYLQKIAATLLESLRECADRDTTDQQYAANVMQMENTYFFTQAIKHRNPIFAELFAKQVTKANAICKDSTDSYLGWMIKREFSSLHELFSRVSKLRKELGDKQVPQQVPKGQFVRILQKEANKDVLKEKIGIMFSRMEKHLSEEGRLLPIAWKALVKVLYEWFGRWEKMCTQIYGYTLKPSAVDIVRIAKAAGGGAKPKQSSTSDFGFKSILALGNKNTAT